MLNRCEHGREEGALLSILVAVAALSRQQYPQLNDRARFEKLHRQYHDWTHREIEFRGTLINTDHLLTPGCACQLVHEAALPPDLRIDHHFADPSSISVRAGGAPEHTVLISPAWLPNLADQTRRRAGERTGDRQTAPASQNLPSQPTSSSEACSSTITSRLSTGRRRPRALAGATARPCWPSWSTSRTG